MDQCVFCDIVQRKLPANRIYENEYILAILDIDPLAEGHTLVFPKLHAEKMHEVPDYILVDIMLAIKQISLALEVPNYNILQNNGEIAYQAIKHTHWHIIPKNGDNDGLNIEWKPCIAQSGEDLSDPALQEKNRSIASTIKERLSLDLS